jgi:calcium/proton exchanger cax
MAMKGKMEITIGVSVGSSIQIAAGMIPILVLAAWPLGKDLTLYFADFEVRPDGLVRGGLLLTGTLARILQTIMLFVSGKNILIESYRHQGATS